MGFDDVRFQYEPIAAAFDYESGIAREELVLIVDIGGGTSDFSVVRLGPERVAQADRSKDILATAGVHIGGTDYDRQLSLQRVMPLLAGAFLVSGLSSLALPGLSLRPLDTARASVVRFELELNQVRGPVCKMRGVAKVDGEVVAEAEMGAMVRDR